MHDFHRKSLEQIVYSFTSRNFAFVIDIASYLLKGILIGNNKVLSWIVLHKK